MTIILYQNASANNTIGKNLTKVIEIEGNFRNEVNVLYPIIDVADYDDIYVPISNYCYIPSLKRYYFINSITCYRKDIYTLELQVDVLESYKEEILELYGIVTQDNNNKYYIANTGNYDVRKEKEVIYLENNFNSEGKMVLTGINSNTI